jgi:RNA polymerase sigma factor (sigma-70 family)
MESETEKLPSQEEQKTIREVSSPMLLNYSQALSQPMLDYDEELRLIEAWQKNQDVRARDKIVSTHMRLCYAVASRWVTNEEHRQDLAQEGVFGLMDALKKYDRMWIKNSIALKLGLVTLVVDVPSRTYRKAKGKMPQDGEVDKVSWEARVAVKGEMALDAPISPNTENTVMDLLCDKAPNPEQNAIENNRNKVIQESVQNALSFGMSPREADILRRRALSEQPETLEYISSVYNVSRERIRQVEHAAISKLKKYLLNNGFPKNIFNPED